jgi:hypothetical protein
LCRSTLHCGHRERRDGSRRLQPNISTKTTRFLVMDRTEPGLPAQSCRC